MKISSGNPELLAPPPPPHIVSSGLEYLFSYLFLGQVLSLYNMVRLMKLLAKTKCITLYALLCPFSRLEAWNKAFWDVSK